MGPMLWYPCPIYNVIEGGFPAFMHDVGDILREGSSLLLWIDTLKYSSSISEQVFSLQQHAVFPLGFVSAEVAEFAGGWWWWMESSWGLHLYSHIIFNFFLNAGGSVGAPLLNAYRGNTGKHTQKHAGLQEAPWQMKTTLYLLIRCWITPAQSPQSLQSQTSISPSAAHSFCKEADPIDWS